MIELPPGRPLVSSEELNRLIRRHRIGWLICQALIIDRIARCIPLDDSEVERLVTEFLAAQQFTGDEAKSNYLKFANISEEDLIWRATTDRRMEIYRHEHYGPDVESHYLERKLQLDQVVYSLIRVRDPDLAHELHQQIQEGETDFQSLAAQFSEGQERESQGLIGPVPMSAAHPEVIQRLRSAQVGQLLEPFFVVDIWLLIRLEQVLPAQLDDELRQKLEEEMFNSWLTEQVQSLLAGGEMPTLPGLSESTS